jgi:acetyltransferase-like isoleucine patch superfamily enzyme
LIEKVSGGEGCACGEGVRVGRSVVVVAGSVVVVTVGDEEGRGRFVRYMSM